MWMGTISHEGYRFLAHTAQMWRVTEAETDHRGWGFRIRTGKPTVEPTSEKPGLYEKGVSIEAEDGPIPLPNVGDLTGVDFRLDPSYDLETGDVYFSFTATHWHEVSQLHIRFLERDGERYRIELSVLVHRVFEEVDEARYEGWIDVVDGPD